MNWNVFEIFLPFSSKITSRLVENESREYFDILTNNKFRNIKFVKIEIYQFFLFDCLQEFNFTISIFSSLVFLSIVEACLGKKKKKREK